ncbi:MAG TPA: hypothetical protein PLP19_07465 [bacterium]|nr:hypothetical protein [bacterium]HPN43310.1 hypothetical protein [bacterium]
MSISSLNFLNLNQSLLNIKTREQIAQNRSNQSANPDTTREDRVVISQELAAKQREAVDFALTQASSFSLQLDYQDNEISLNSATGFFNYKQQKIDLTMGIQFSIRSEINGQMVEQQYKLDLSISFEKTRLTEGTVRLHKEDINMYIMRIVKTLSDFAKEKDINIAALFLDDMEELAAVKDGKLLEQIFALVSAMYWTKKMFNDNTEDYLLYIPRKKQNVLEINQEDTLKININVSLDKEISVNENKKISQAVQTVETSSTDNTNKEENPIV